MCAFNWQDSTGVAELVPTIAITVAQTEKGAKIVKEENKFSTSFVLRIVGIPSCKLAADLCNNRSQFLARCVLE